MMQSFTTTPDSFHNPRTPDLEELTRKKSQIFKNIKIPDNSRNKIPAKRSFHKSCMNGLGMPKKTKNKNISSTQTELNQALSKISTEIDFDHYKEDVYMIEEKRVSMTQKNSKMYARTGGGFVTLKDFVCKSKNSVVQTPTKFKSPLNRSSPAKSKNKK